MEGVEEVGGVVRAGGRLGVILHARGPCRAVAHSLDRAVIEGAVGDLEFGGTRRFINGEAGGL